MKHSVPSFPTDYASIIERVHQINPASYARTRNFLDGAVTYLSPYISRGVISTRLVLDTLLQKGYSIRSMEKLVQELAWRDYFQQVWKSIGDRLFTDIKQAQPLARHQQSMPAALLNASTSIHAIDQCIEQLYATGYMHNHARMYTASIACNIAGAHWSMPAAWMYYHLLDGDIASNTCSWQWVAGAFSSKLYWCNQENINKYTGQQQRGSFLDQPYEAFPLKQTPDALKAQCSPQWQTPLPETTAPTIDADKPVLLYTHYHLDPNWRKAENATRILLLEPSHFQRFPVSEKVIDFVLQLARNIEGIQVYAGECKDLPLEGKQVYTREHPAFSHLPGVKDPRDWLSPEVQGYFPSFFAYWKKLERRLT